MVDFVVFAISAAIVLGGALGVIGFRNPVHNALSLIATLLRDKIIMIKPNKIINIIYKGKK